MRRNHTIISVPMEPEHVRLLAQLAKQNERSRVAEIRLAVAEYLAREAQKDEDPERLAASPGPSNTPSTQPLRRGGHAQP